MIKIKNTLSGKLEEFEPIRGKKVNMFVCGPTVYDYSHIGHAKTYIFFDVVAKYLRHLGYKVFYLQNITDIDDKIINRAKEQNKKPKEIAEEFEKKYFEDFKALRVDSINKYARASKHIKQIIRQVDALIKKGCAYATPAVDAKESDAVKNTANQDVYFDISKFPEFGKLSKQNLDELETGVRIKTEENKRNPKDFVLWKAQNFSYEPSWKSPWGYGRPGWHIEDTAISEKYLGQQYDIHCGAQDLIFPHHEAEIAQQESASGKKPFVKYWLHTGWLTVNGQKMSKSLGNFITIRDILKNYSPEALRVLTLSSYYRSPVDYTKQMMKQSQAAANRIAEFWNKLERADGTDNKEIEKYIAEANVKFEEAMDNDFNTPTALAAIFDLIRTANLPLAEQKVSKSNAKKIKKFLEKIDFILGILIVKKPQIPDEVSKLVGIREEMRQKKDWAEADKIRDEISRLGYSIEDTSYGPYLRKSKV